MAGSVLHHHSILLCHHAHIDKLLLAHAAQNSKLEKNNMAMAVLAGQQLQQRRSAELEH